MSIMTHVRRRVSTTTVERKLRALRAEQRQARIEERRYDGGLPAELSSLRTIRTSRRDKARTARRQILLSRVGRRIDLSAILKQRRADGLPRWTIADPDVPMELGYQNGVIDTRGGIRIGHHYLGSGWTGMPEPKRALTPSGLPALPPRVRELASDPQKRRRAKWVGVLYQPEEWEEINPDPALVVEWQAEPGVYYALAVWGDDGPAIMEFVD